MISYESIGFSISRAFLWIPKEGLAFRRKFKLKPQPRKLRSEWVGALHQPKDGQTRFSDKIRGYLQKKVDMVQKTWRGKIMHK